MKKWLQRTVGTASLACGIALAAAGIASANGNQPAELSNPLGSVGSLTSVADTKTVNDLTNSRSVVPDDAKQVTSNLVDLSTNTAADTVKKANGDFVSGINEAGTEDLPVVGQLPVVGGLTQGGLPVAGGSGDMPGKKSVTKTTATKTEGLPVADGLPVVGGLTQGGLPVVGGGGNPVTGGAAGSDMLDGVPLVGNMTGSAVRSMAPGADKAGKPENLVGMGADLVGSKVLGSGAVGGLRGDVTRPAEDLPLVGQLPVVGQLGNAVPMGSTPLGVDKLGPK